MVQSVNSPNIPIEPNPVGGSQTNSPHVTENKVSIFENSVLELKIRVLNDTQLLRASRTVQSFGDCFTANMAGKRGGSEKLHNFLPIWDFIDRIRKNCFGMLKRISVHWKT